MIPIPEYFIGYLYLSTLFDTHHVSGNIQLLKMPPEATGILVSSRHAELPPDFTTPQTVWVVAAAVVGQSHAALNQRMLAANPYKVFFF